VSNRLSPTNEIKMSDYQRGSMKLFDGFDAMLDESLGDLPSFFGMPFAQRSSPVRTSFVIVSPEEGSRGTS
jgi:hypothetical protein